METTLSKVLLLLDLADIVHKVHQRCKTWGRFNNVCTKLESARSKSNQILEINVLLTYFFAWVCVWFIQLFKMISGEHERPLK